MDQRTDSERRPGTAPSREVRPADRSSAQAAGVGRSLRQKRRAVLVVTALIIAAIVAVVFWWINTSGYESTDDAFIDARTVSISSQVNAAIVDVPVTDNELVDAGAVLVRLDDRDYKAQLDQAHAQVDQATAGIANIDAQIAAQQSRIEEADKQANQAHASLTFAQHRTNATRRW